MSVVFLVDSGRKIVVVLIIFFKTKNPNGNGVADQLKLNSQISKEGRRQGGYCKPSKLMI